MHACSSIENEEQWKFVDQIFVIRHVLATRPLLPGATGIVFVVLKKKSQYQQPNVWHMSERHYLPPRIKVLQRSSSSSRLLLRAASSRTWIYKQLSVELRQIIIFFCIWLCWAGVNNEQRASWSSSVCAETFDRTNCFVHSLSNYQRVNWTNYNDSKPR